ncbi:MAG: hypothetical protein A2233_02645 [Candidatus Kerfeldbacteria bacterium RIFOXYA2_FULL_38_24]|uniref:N-acetyltransferase domain-containing protein n=1 Tax=Candidatus Kerfeldbacteria bacterium RIFOXYB2_FULL_38_14 TaxID=1798547 RepID=A0A1G2BIF0_9BACT|nr:MAG: hypothetical protein A2233_02645 [Candidatus Kerfeldbacteria bacterium RIFOXYA2_FULL_38_24]OGY88329.1 MAG: hypothetical protein A2319_03355 [Candidatus Kerfeldbacteria bacterium RIFOXYB2_FULL_38_14]OGY89316.1 MAG: hypothetical protein A2458_05180 [Candidatus Kerfeldbacteria bacterium RIFOXYC2_FULL_38_9]
MEETTVRLDGRIIVLEAVGDETFRKVNSFVEEVYVRAGHITHFVSFPDVYFYAVRGEKIVGAIGLLKEGSDGNFPSEVIFGISLRTITHSRTNGSKVIEIGRFAVTQEGVAEALIRYLHQYLMINGFRFAIASLKPYMAAHLEKMGVVLVRHQYRPIISAVPAEYLPYFGGTPRPILVSMDVELFGGKK